MDNEIQHTSFRCATTKTNIIIAEFIDAASAIVEIILPGHDYVCVKQVIKSENCLSVRKIILQCAWQRKLKKMNRFYIISLTDE